MLFVIKDSPVTFNVAFRARALILIYCMPVRIIYASLFHPPSSSSLSKQHASVFSCHNKLSRLIHCAGTVFLPAVAACPCLEAARGADLHSKVNMPVESSFRSVDCAFRTSHAERDASMKRQLVEDMKTRLKFVQEIEKSYRGQVEDLEKKVDEEPR